MDKGKIKKGTYAKVITDAPTPETYGAVGYVVRVTDIDGASSGHVIFSQPVPMAGGGRILSGWYRLEDLELVPPEEVTG